MSLVATMFATLDQENITSIHQKSAASKTLNQSSRVKCTKMPSQAFKTPFRVLHDENAPLNAKIAIKGLADFATPAAKPAARAPLGAKTTNAKATSFQTPAPGQKAVQNQDSVKKPSTTRRSAKRKICVAPDFVQQEPEPTGDEPDFGYAPSPIEPLADPPIDVDIEPLYASLSNENFPCGVGDIYFQSPKDENGFSISQKKEQAADQNSLDQDLKHMEQLDAVPRTSISTLKSRQAVAAISQQQPVRVRAHQRLPSAATRETASSKQKRKVAPSFAAAQEGNIRSTSKLMPVPRSTIGFPKAKATPSIIPRTEHDRWRDGIKATLAKDVQNDASNPSQSQLSPRKYVQLYGEPPVESEQWFRLMELEIRDRRRGDEVQPGTDSISIFHMDEADDLDQELGLHFSDVGDDFELSLE